jgi:cyclic pyranopterin phosphate synthase
MPEEEYVWLKSPDILSFEEISTLVDRFIATGVDKVRLTGGEPLVRRDLPELVRQLAAKPLLRDLSMTTNGVLLAEHAQSLKEVGLHRVTVSLDTLSPTKFAKLTRRNTHGAVLTGIAEARRVGFLKGLKLDTVVTRGVNDGELVELLEFAGDHQAELRFIEYMDVGGATKWSMAQVVSRQEMLDALTTYFGRIEPLSEVSSAPAQRFRLKDGRTFGIIASTTQPFCGRCDRARLTADGRYFTCLYAAGGVDLKTPLRARASGDELEGRISGVWRQRADRGAEERLGLRGVRGPLASASELRAEPHLEMHTRGG